MCSSLNATSSKIAFDNESKWTPKLKDCNFILYEIIAFSWETSIIFWCKGKERWNKIYLPNRKIVKFLNHMTREKWLSTYSSWIENKVPLPYQKQTKSEMQKAFGSLKQEWKSQLKKKRLVLGN